MNLRSPWIVRWGVLTTLMAIVCLGRAQPPGAITLTEDFSSDPLVRGWQVFGDPSLFAWDSTNQILRVTWDSSRPNSYFHLPLGTILTRADDFAVSFDLTFSNYAGGVTPGKPGAFEVAMGLLNLDQATQTNFSRGAGLHPTYGPKNLVEFNFFPAFDRFSPTIAQAIVATNNSSWLYNHDNQQEMTPGEQFRVTMRFQGSASILTTTVTNRASLYGAPQTIFVPPTSDFRVTTFSISSYSDQRSLDSLLAHGVVDNLTITLPPPPVQNFTGGFSNLLWRAQFRGRTNWHYVLQATTDFSNWTPVSPPLAGGDGWLWLPDTNSPALSPRFYRMQAIRP